jgi:hypothetical protein
MITALYWSLSAPAIEGVLDRIRTTLVELVAEMRAGMPEAAEVPSREVADHAVQVAVHGDQARVTVTAASASGEGSHRVTAEGGYVETTRVDAAWPELREELAGLGVPGEELEQLHTALVADGDPVSAQLGPATRGWIGSLSQKAATGALALGSAVSTETITHVILKALGLG